MLGHKSDALVERGVCDFVFVIAHPFSNSCIAESSTDLSGSPRADDLIRELAHSKLSDAQITGLHSRSIAVSIPAIKSSKFCF